MKSLYDLKQSPKQWHQKLDRVIMDYAFLVNEYGKFVYSKVMNDRYVILYLYVDETLIYEPKLEDILVVKDYLSKMFDTKDLGEADIILVLLKGLL